MRVSFFTKYTRAGPSSRYRFYQYIPCLEAAGFKIQTYPLLGDAYIDALFAKTRVPIRNYLQWFVNRILQLRHARNSRLLFIEYELFPYFPFVFERFFLPKNVKIIFEFDDAIHVRYRKYPWLRRKIDRLIREADGVVVASSYLYDYATRFNSNVHLLPSALDLQRYPPRKTSLVPFDRVVIGWIGTPVTSHFLRSIGEPLQAVMNSHHAVLRCIGVSPNFELRDIPIERVPWSESTEVPELQKCQIGIMPLPPGDFEAGKSGLKLIQYMACGLPCVASPVGAATEIITDEENGFLARTVDEWRDRLALLVQNADLRTQMGARARRTVEQCYSLDVAVAKLIQVFRSFAG